MIYLLCENWCWENVAAYWESGREEMLKKWGSLSSPNEASFQPNPEEKSLGEGVCRPQLKLHRTGQERVDNGTLWVLCCCGE